MEFYIGTAVTLWLLSLPKVVGNVNSKVSFVFSTVIIIIIFLVFAFRYQTGFDWVIYNQYFNTVGSSPLFSVDSAPVKMEPLYYLLNYITSVFGGFQLLLFVVASINIFCASIFFRKFQSSASFCYAFAFCWVLLPMWMGTIRQSLAVSMILLSVVRYSEGKEKSSAACVVLAIGFQYSAAMYGLAYLKRFNGFLIKNSDFIIAVALSFYFISPRGFGQIIVDHLASLGLPFISEKLSIYASFGSSTKSYATAAFVMVNCFFFLYVKKKVNNEDKVDSFFLSILLWLVLTQTFLFDFALAWNRMLYVAVFVQSIMLYKTLMGFGYRSRAMLMLSVILVSMMPVSKLLNSDASVPFVPYQNYILSELFSEKGDGMERAVQYYQLFESNRSKTID